jgi:hypothetical protein
MLLRVKSSVQIPHVITIQGKTVQFNPDAEVPESWGIVALKSQSHIYEPAEGEPDLKTYKVKDFYVNKSFEEIFNSLSSESRLKMIELAKQMHKDENQPKEMEVKSLDEMTLSELKAYAEEKKIVIPYTVTKKDSILAFIIEAEKKE